MTKFLRGPLRHFIKELASSSVTPGGGSAAALVVATGTALLEMTARINAEREKKKTGKINSAAVSRIRELEKVGDSALDLIERDAEAFKRLAKYFGKDKSDRGFQKAIGHSAEIPLEMCELCLRALELMLPERGRTSRWLASDLAEGALLLDASFHAAHLNVEVNLREISDRRRVQRTRRRLDVWRRRAKKCKDELLKAFNP
ncbi:MAG: cyclodeaminase/cyclohydrolase family protein [Candidatus Omnitrophica bacterium]|nr:cyclodeaminase/cyclohydrolase family protein [Candidatus Omnitrophota bacterium]